MQPERCCTNFKFTCLSVRLLLGKLEVYVNSVSFLHQHLILAVGKTANCMFYNLRCGYCAPITIITQQTAQGLSCNRRSCYRTTIILITLYTYMLSVS
jgi:hypothetical protein